MFVVVSQSLKFANFQILVSAIICIQVKIYFPDHFKILALNRA